MKFPVNKWLIFSLGILSGCSSTSIFVPVIRPAEIHLQGYQGVAVGFFATDVPWDHGFDPQTPVSDLRNFLLADLIQRLDFHPIDLQDFSDRLSAKGISSTDKINGNALPVIREITGADCLITGTILQLRFDEGINSAEVKQPDMPVSYKNVRKGLLRMSVEISVIDLKDAEIAWRDTLKAEVTSEKRAANVDPPSNDPEELRVKALRIIIADFISRATPREEKEVVTFLIDRDYPEITSGIKAAERGDWQKAVRIFMKAVERASGKEDEDRIWYNLGIAQQYSNNFRAAEEAFRKANSLKENKRYQHALRNLRNMEQEYLELLNQKKQ